MTVSTINAEREQTEDIFDLEVKELGDPSPFGAQQAQKMTSLTCTFSVVCCCCSA